jgi:hypothetical protein
MVGAIETVLGRPTGVLDDDHEGFLYLFDKNPSPGKNPS